MQENIDLENREFIMQEKKIMVAEGSSVSCYDQNSRNRPKLSNLTIMVCNLEDLGVRGEYIKILYNAILKHFLDQKKMEKNLINLKGTMFHLKVQLFLLIIRCSTLRFMTFSNFFKWWRKPLLNSDNIGKFAASCYLKSMILFLYITKQGEIWC